MASCSSPGPGFDVVAHAGKDNSDLVGHGGSSFSDVVGHAGTDYEVVLQAGADSSNVAGHGHTHSMDVIVVPSASDIHPVTDVMVHTSTDTSVFHENTDMVDHKKISSSMAVVLDHAYTESTAALYHVQTASANLIHQLQSVLHENTDMAVSESTSQTQILEQVVVGGQEDTTVGLESISSTNIVDCAHTDTLDEAADNVIAYSTSVVDGADTCITTVLPQTRTFVSKTDSAVDQASTDSVDDLVVHTSSTQVDSAVKKSHISRNSSQPSHQRFSTPVAVKEIASVPDCTPSRRSSRKKQSTFSSDFEYYALGSMKIEMKSEPMLSYKPRQATSEAQEDDSDQQNQSDDGTDDDRMTKMTTKKVAEKKHKLKISEADDSEKDEADEEVQNEKEIVKVAGKKKIPKFNTLIKGIKKKKIQKEEEDSEVDEDSNEERNENHANPKLMKGLKRKNNGSLIKVQSKKMKVESDQEDESSDEEESTPISLLKAKLKEESTPISQLKDKLKEESIPISKLKAELKEESIPISKLMAKLKDLNPNTQHKKEASHSTSEPTVKSVEDLDAFLQLQAQIRQKREVEKKAITQGRSLMERLADGTLDLSVDYDRSAFHSQKRKLMSGDGNVTDEIPSKISKSIHIDRLAPALANLVKLHGHAKPKSSNIVRPETAASNHTGHKKIHPSSTGSSAAGSSHKKKVKIEGSVLKKSESPAKKGVLEKPGVSKSHREKGDSLKHLKERKPDGEDVRYITKVKVIRKPDGTIIKKKVLVPERESHQSKDVKVKKISSPEKGEGKKTAKTENIKTDYNHKPGVTSDKMSTMKHNGKLQGDGFKKRSHELSSKDGSGVKYKHSLKAKIEHDRKQDRPSLTVDDLLKRGVFHKKKRHQPFGNKHLSKPAVKDLKSETVRDPTKTERVEKESRAYKKGDKLETNKSKSHKLSHVHKHSGDKGRSRDSSKSRRKSADAGRKKMDKPSDLDEGKDDGPPVLIPASSLSKSKHRHHKVEQELPVDVTMNDLFKPDTNIPESPSKDVVQDNMLYGLGDKLSPNSLNTHDAQSGVKPDHIYNIMIEHQYSKPASPVRSSQDGQVVDSANTGRDDDIESISHAKAVVMDVNLPDQFLEESDEPAATDPDHYQQTWPDTMEELQNLVDRRDTADRSSILESLGSELEESGTEFLIVGQVEVGRVPALLREERQSSRGLARRESWVESEKTNSASSEERKASVDGRKQSLHKKSDSTHRRSSFADSERKSSTKDNMSSSEYRKSSLYDRKPSNDKKDSSDYKKSESDDKKKYSSDDRKKNSSDDRKKNSSDDRKKNSSDDRKKNSSDDRKKNSSDDRKKNSSDDRKKNSSDDRKKNSSDDRTKSSSDDKKKGSSESKKNSASDKIASCEKRKNADDRSGNVDTGKYKDSKKPDSTGLKPGDDGLNDDSGEEPKFEDDENDIDWEPNDTDTLYCICRKPHNNRFMICCDKCEEWFHGTCVGVSRARGKEMEDNEEEYICPFCAKGDHDSSMETLAQSFKSPEKVKSKLLHKCVGRKCNKAPRSGSVYCSNECVMSHAQEALKTIREQQVKTKQSSDKQSSTHGKSSSSSASKTPALKSSVSAETVEVIERETGKLLTGSSAPTQKGLHRWLEQHPTFEVVLPHKHRSKSSSSKDKQSRSDKDKTSSADRDRHKSDKDRKRSETDRRDNSSSKDSSRQSEAEKQQTVNSQTSDGSRIDDRRGDGQKQIRVNVQTALGDCLAARAQEADDVMLSSNEVKSLAVTIEEELFSVFSDTGHKYRTKYRSLVFNIKDQKNKGLFRKILTGKIKPHKLVQMSTEELASKELAMWREQASKHQLEMIQKTEQQALKESAGAKHVRKKTHKGEVEVEDEDLSILETRLEEKKDPEPEPQEEQPQMPVIDTTDQHRAHLFDLNCKVCTGKIVPGRAEQLAKAVSEKPAAVTFEQPEEKKEVQPKEDKEDYEKAEEIVKEAFRTMQKMEKSVSSLPKIVSSSSAVESATPPLSPKLVTSRRESSSSSASSMSSSSTRRTVVVRSPDSALQSGLESKFTPTGPVLWKGFMSMLDVAKFFTSAYRVSGPTDHITIPDTINILGRISPEQMWDYLSKIRQAGSKDLTIVRFIPGNDDQKVAYVHLYSYLNSRGRCGVAANTNKQIKDFYIIPLASHSKIPRTLLPFDGPGLEENRPHMLIGVLVRQRGKHATDASDAGKSGTQSTSVSSSKSGSQSSSSSSGKSGSQTGSSSSVKPSSHRSTASSNTKLVAPVVSRDPRLAKLAAREAIPKASPAESSIYVTSTTQGAATEEPDDEYEPEYVPMPVNAKNAYKPVAEYIPTPTVKKKHAEKDSIVNKKDRTPQANDLLDKNSRARTEKHHRHQEKIVEKIEEIEDDSDPYSPGKEAEPYSPGQEAAADEPYDPADDSLMNETDVPLMSSLTVSSSSTASTSGQPAAVTEHPSACVAAHSSAIVEPPATGVATLLQKDTKVSTLELIEKMAHSNDPEEISAFMVKALSVTSSASEQQKMLVELTSRVEERKLQLAETARSETARSETARSEREEDSQKLEGENLTEDGIGINGIETGKSPQIVQVSQGAASSGGSDTSTDVLGSVAVDSSLEQKASSSLLLHSFLPVSLATPTTAPEAESSSAEPKLLLETSHCQDVDKSTVKTAAASESSGGIPDALKALINDVMGNTQVSSLEMRRRMALKKEVQKVDMSSKEVKEDMDTSDSQVVDRQAEAQKRLMDEAEALRILQTVKQLEQTGSQVSVEHVSSVGVADGGCVTATAATSVEYVPEAVDTRKETPSIAPSIDQLLEKLKSGGFQFPAQKADTVGPSSSVSSSLAPPAVSVTSDSPSSVVSRSELPATITSLAPPTVSASAVGSSSLFSASALDLDLRQKNDFPGSSSQPTSALSVSSSSGSVDSQATDYGNYSSRAPSSLHNQDDAICYQDRDDRLPRQSAPPVPKHPLDPYAFPPLPGKSRTYLPPARSNLPLPLGPLHPRFPLPSTDPQAAYDPTPSASLRAKVRVQPSLPGAEYEKPPAVSRLVDDLSTTDVDFRSRSQVTGFQDRVSPPVPAQQQATLPPPPGNIGGSYSNQILEDVDLRARDPYRPPRSHHTGHHGRGGDRPYQRH